MITKIVNDLYAITGIPKLTLENLITKTNTCIGHAVWESLTTKDTITEIDLGIGILYIKLEGDNLKYKFIPSASLEDVLHFTVLNKTSPLVAKVESSIQKKIENTYKELL